MREKVDGGVRELVAVFDGKPVYLMTLNKNAAISTAANLVRDDSSFGVDGSGIHVGVWDGGSVLTNHIEFGSRVIRNDASAFIDHGTHVAGTIGAAGVNVNAKGMAPGVFIESYDWTNDVAEVSAAGASGPGQSDAIYLSNHSYSYDGSANTVLYGLYGDAAREMDQALLGLEYCLPFIASGNDGGYETLTLYSISKNVITVGSVQDAVADGERTTGEGTRLSSFSSCGPTDDGRIKPDIVANGDLVTSSVASGSQSYLTYSGTSMASPNACGSAALLVEYFQNQMGGDAMWASTLKGLIIHTADDLGRYGPDYQYGWGLMNTLKAAALIQDFASGETNRMVEATLAEDGAAQIYTITSFGLSPLCVTLCWTDQPGISDNYSDDDRDADLVNDLDLKVTAPDGQVFYPFSLSYSDETAVASTNSENSVDNVEQVFIAHPIKGEYVITVDCDETLRTYSEGSFTFLRGGFHPPSFSVPSLEDGGTQNYSLLVSGLVSDADGDGLPNDWEKTYFGDETSADASADSDGDGFSNLEEYVTGNDPTDSASVFSVICSAAADDAAVVSWNALDGRRYTLEWTTNLVRPFSALSTFNYPVEAYTNNAVDQAFFRVGVELGE